MHNGFWIALLLLSCLIALPLKSEVFDRSRCLNNLETTFFERKIVTRALSLYEIPQSLWEKIKYQLELESRSVPERMRRVTAGMVPNPIEYPIQPGLAARILKDVLFDVLFDTLKKYQVDERPTADYIFDYIFSQQINRFIDCFGEEVLELKPDFA